MFDVDRNQWSETNHLIFKNESYIHQHISSPYKWNNCNGYGKSIPWKKFWRKNITRIFFPSGTNILRNKYTLTSIGTLQKYWMPSHVCTFQNLIYYIYQHQGTNTVPKSWGTCRPNAPSAFIPSITWSSTFSKASFFKASFCSYKISTFFIIITQI